VLILNEEQCSDAGVEQYLFLIFFIPLTAGITGADTVKLISILLAVIAVCILF